MFQTFQYLLLANLLCLDSKLFPMTHGDADFNLNTFQDTNDLVSFAFFGDRLLRQSMGQIKFWDQENSTSMFVCVNNGKFVYVWFYWFLTTCICPKVCFIFMKFPVSQQWTLNSSYKLSSISYLYYPYKIFNILEYVSLDIFIPLLHFGGHPEVLTPKRAVASHPSSRTLLLPGGQHLQHLCQDGQDPVHKISRIYQICIFLVDSTIAIGPKSPLPTLSTSSPSMKHQRYVCHAVTHEFEMV